MKAVSLRHPGGLDRLELVDLEEAQVPRPGEVTVRIRASSINYHDYLVVAGKAPAADKLIPLSDGAGDIVAVGDGVTE
jgi:NADPH:quinone reductase-like Zn-dependent oxidoreductase